MNLESTHIIEERKKEDRDETSFRAPYLLRKPDCL